MTAAMERRSFGRRGRRQARMRRSRAPLFDSFNQEGEDDAAEKVAVFDLLGELPNVDDARRKLARVRPWRAEERGEGEGRGARGAWLLL